MKKAARRRATTGLCMCPFSSSPWRRTYSSKSSLSLLSRRSSGINRSFFPLSSFVQRAVTLPLYPTITTPLGDRRRSFATQQEAKEKEDEEDAAAKGPLAGVKVLDLGRILAAPYCSMVLGDLGAEIWKVEVPGTGDDTRTWGPPFTAKGHESAYFISCNRNKKSIAVDLKKPQGLKIVHELAKHADVLIENFAPGKADSLGVGYSALSTLNPRLIYLSLTGFGPDGPYKDRLAYDVMVSGFGGLMSITGPEEGAPVKTGVALTDICAGLYAHGAIIAALYAREKSGKGQKIDVSLLESQVATLANVASSYLIGGMEPKRMGTAHSSIVPYQAFATANRGHILIGALNDGQFQRLCEVIGRPELSSDEKFKTNPKRVQNRKELIALLSDIIKTQTTSEWVTLLDSVKVPCGPINTIREVFQDPQVLHRDMLQKVEHPTAGTISVTGPPVKFSRTKAKIRSAPPVLGQHTDELLSSVLGYNQETIRRLRESGACA